MTFSNDVEINHIKIKMLLHTEKQNFAICLETIEAKELASCVCCSAYFHINCINNPNYPCTDFENIYCCVCKKIIGSVV